MSNKFYTVITFVLLIFAIVFLAVWCYTLHTRVTALETYLQGVERSEIWEHLTPEQKKEEMGEIHQEMERINRHWDNNGTNTEQ